MQMINYLKYSGCNVIVKLNPYHWDIGFRAENDMFDGKIYNLDLVMFTLRVWIDDGNW